MSEKKSGYGFVYIWFDRKHKRYYIGSHWGTEDDGYICSSSWMKRAYKLRPEDFKPRRTIVKIYTNRHDLLVEEHRWLQMIKPEEISPNTPTPRYYNLNLNFQNHWTADKQKQKTVREKLSQAIKKRREDPEYCERVRLATIEGNRNRSEEAKRRTKEKHSIKSKEMWQRPEYKEKQNKHKHRLMEYWTTEEGKNRLETNRPEMSRRQKERLETPEHRKSCGWAKGQKSSPEQIEIRRRGLIKQRNLQKANAVAHIKNPAELYAQCKYSIAKMMETTGLTRKQIEYLLEINHIDRKRHETIRMLGNKYTKGNHWWNNGMKEISAKECPGPDWKRGRI